MNSIKRLTVIVLMIAILIILTTKVEATTGKVNSETVRLRKEPNTSSTILEQLDKNKEVEILEEEDNWYKVNVDIKGEKITGYISASLVDVEKNEEKEDKTQEVSNNTTMPVEEQPQKNTNNEPQSEEPNTDISNDIDENQEYTLNQETSVKVLPVMNSIEKANFSGTVKVIEIINDWCRIENDAGNGWIRITNLKKLISENPEESTTTVTPTEPDTNVTDDTTTSSNKEPDTTTVNAPVIKNGYVTVDGLRVRKEASTASEALDSLSKNAKVEIIEELDKWYKIKFGDETGYVSAQYISDTKVPETTSRSGSTLKQENKEPETPVTEAPEPSENVSSTGTTGEEIVEFAKQYVGYKYVSGGTTPENGFDCSGFTTYVFKHFGISLYRTSRDQIKNGVAVEKSNLQPGDIVVFNNEANSNIGHVGIYIGGGNFIHAANSREGVKITSLSSSYYTTRYVGARRVI